MWLSVSAGGECDDWGEVQFAASARAGGCPTPGPSAGYAGRCEALGTRDAGATGAARDCFVKVAFTPQV